MATCEFYHDDAKDEGVITFRIPDKELQSAELGLMEHIVLKMSTGGVLELSQNLLIILEGIERAKETKKRNVSKQN